MRIARTARHFEKLRLRMVSEQIERRGVSAPAVLAAFRKVPRHLFAPLELRSSAYGDYPIPLGPEQTISQPYIIALMMETLVLTPDSRVLEIGTGSGYEAALLAETAAEVYSVEIEPGLYARALRTLQELGYGNVFLLEGDGHLGWPEKAPFDAIILSAAPGSIPRDLVKQLKTGGRMVLPLGTFDQRLVCLEKTPAGLKSTDLGGVRFVEMKRGAAQASL